VNQDLFHGSGYKNKLSEPAAADQEGKKADETKAIMGDVASSEEIVDTDTRRMVVKMAVPEWICTAICAGIDVDGLSDGSAIEDSEEVAERDPHDMSNLNNPLFQTEEGHHIYTKR